MWVLQEATIVHVGWGLGKGILYVPTIQQVNKAHCKFVMAHLIYSILGSIHIQIPLTGYVCLILRSTAVAAQVAVLVEGTMRVL